MLPVERGGAGGDSYLVAAWYCLDTGNSRSFHHHPDYHCIWNKKVIRLVFAPIILATQEAKMGRMAVQNICSTMSQPIKLDVVIAPVILAMWDE
jgi:hypothetical protein